MPVNKIFELLDFIPNKTAIGAWGWLVTWLLERAWQAIEPLAVVDVRWEELATQVFSFGYDVFGLFLGVGIGMKVVRNDSTRSVATAILGAVLGVGLLTSAAPALADCDFDKHDLDAKVFRAGYPAAVGFDLALASFEIGVARKGDFACMSAEANPLGLVCLIPKVGDVLEGASLCTKPFEPN